MLNINYKFNSSKSLTENDVNYNNLVIPMSESTNQVRDQFLLSHINNSDDNKQQLSLIVENEQSPSIISDREPSSSSSNSSSLSSSSSPIMDVEHSPSPLNQIPPHPINENAVAKRKKKCFSIKSIVWILIVLALFTVSFRWFSPFVEPSKLEPSNFEPSKLEPSKLEPSKLEPSKLEPSKFKHYSRESTVYEDNITIPEGTELLAIKGGHNLPINYPLGVKELIFLDGFDQSIEDIPNTVETLFFFNISFKLQPHSIPYFINCLHFDKGFDQKITNGIIPNSVQTISLGNIVQPLDINSMSSVTAIGLEHGYKHKLIIPDSVNFLWIGDIEQFEIASIPTSVTTLTFTNQFKHSIKGLIPNSVWRLQLGYLIQPLDINSIPSSVTHLTFLHYYNHKLVIPNSIQYLSIGCIGEPLDIGTIPPSVAHLSFGNENTYNNDIFKHKIVKGLIPPTVKHLYLYNIEHPLDNGSIPNDQEEILVQYLLLLYSLISLYSIIIINQKTLLLFYCIYLNKIIV